MVREIHDHSNGHVTLSSIALLQERFRQLEKMKELRQEKELLKMLSKSERNNTTPEITTPHDERRTTTFWHNCQLSLSLCRPDSQMIKYEDPRGMMMMMMDQGPSSTLVKSCFADDAPIELDRSHIDTSLRL